MLYCHLGLPTKMHLSKVTSGVLTAKSYDLLPVLMLLDLTSDISGLSLHLETFCPVTSVTALSRFSCLFRCALIIADGHHASMPILPLQTVHWGGGRGILHF